LAAEHLSGALFSAEVRTSLLFFMLLIIFLGNHC
jgi:hypothetical protein